MTEAAAPSVEAPRRFHFDWIPGVFFKPRQAFRTIAAQNTGVWLTPMLALTITTLLRVLMAGSLRQAAAASGNFALPPDFQWYSPEQQAQLMQAMQAMQGPVFTIVFPALSALAGLWFGWLILSGMLHLGLTLIGGRGDTSGTMNIVAWASLPLALRDLVRILVMMDTDQLIQYPGLAGFATLGPEGATSGGLFLVALLSLIDIYLLWRILLVVIGVRAANGLAPAKSVLGVVAVFALVLALQALIGFLGSRFSGLTVIRPFF